ncbi:WecB/TagA/CpsF family glycosyltransferase, partial [Bacillus pumilus]|uniref:WecB/TagA/CpsF family glycosyltransferase n=1 Tax=Bacillus pumilus TaxID=1408 RepID=UPI0037048741
MPAFDLFISILHLPNNHSKTIFLYPPKKQLLHPLKQPIHTQYPNLLIPPTSHPYQAHKPFLPKQIPPSKPHILFLPLAYPNHHN